MFKGFLHSIFYNRLIAKLVIKVVLRAHNLCYRLAGQFALILNNGIHPKHYILKYKEWFLKNIEHDWTILDIGCNTGAMTLLLAQKAKFVYGIEMNDRYVSIAKMQQARDNIDYICADATSYDYSLCRDIDCVTMSNVLEHIENRIIFLKRLVHRIKWANNKQRWFLFRVPVFDREWIVPYKKEMGVEYRLDTSHYVEYTLENFAEEMEQSGISIIDTSIHFGELYAVCKVVHHERNQRQP